MGRPYSFGSALSDCQPTILGLGASVHPQAMNFFASIQRLVSLLACRFRTAGLQTGCTGGVNAASLSVRGPEAPVTAGRDAGGTTSIRLLLLLLLACMLLGRTSAQTVNLDPGLSGDQPYPTVTFEWASRTATPVHYAITADSMGRAAYRADEVGSNGIQETQTGAPYLLDFILSSATSARIFALAHQADYFRGSSPATPGGRDTAIKTLRYSEGASTLSGHWTSGVRNETTYAVSNNPAIRQLTDIFERISATVELGRRLDSLYRSHDPALVGELRRANTLAEQHGLLELQAIAVSLHDLANDPALPPAARQDARNLLDLAASPSSSH